MDLVLPLARLGLADLAVAGGKAANLSELLRAGLPVPDGFCVTMAAYQLQRHGRQAIRRCDTEAREAKLRTISIGGGRTAIDIAWLTAVGILLLAWLLLPVKETAPESLDAAVEKLLPSEQSA